MMIANDILVLLSTKNALIFKNNKKVLDLGESKWYINSASEKGSEKEETKKCRMIFENWAKTLIQES